MSDLRQRVFLQSLLFGCLLSALTLSISHTFFGPRYGEAEDAEATPCWQSDANSEPALAVSGPETNLSSLDAEEQLRNLLSLLRCNDMDECIRHARTAGVPLSKRGQSGNFHLQSLSTGFLRQVGWRGARHIPSAHPGSETSHSAGRRWHRRRPGVQRFLGNLGG